MYTCTMISSHPLLSMQVPTSLNAWESALEIVFLYIWYGIEPPWICIPPHEISHCVFEQYLDIKTGHDHFIC